MMASIMDPRNYMLPSQQPRQEAKERFECPFCKATFTRKSNMERHKQTHTGFKYICATCGKNFWDSYYLKTHLCKGAAEEKKHESDHQDGDDQGDAPSTT